ncbi:MAG: hypothetical protein O2887_17805 [Bacteroidetes bacterium]|nr:hypothetical protein [Bacteroidota bacterium]MDA1122312.1 hypothetical protein [Bacteroidota bacterium]
MNKAANTNIDARNPLFTPAIKLLMFGIKRMNLRILNTRNNLKTSRYEISGMSIKISNKDGDEITTMIKSNLFPEFEM